MAVELMDKSSFCVPGGRSELGGCGFKIGVSAEALAVLTLLPKFFSKSDDAE